MVLGLTRAVGRPPSAGDEQDLTLQRHAMVEQQIAARGIRDAHVLDAMLRVPRHEFVPGMLRTLAYDDRPLPIGHKQTISQPYIVALMSESLDLRGDEVVLEVGTGSGYQAAVLGELAARVYTIEIIPELAERAAKLLERLGYDNVTVRAGDGYRGWPEAAPFDAIMVTASPDHVPQPLLEQLKPGGRLVLPVGQGRQHLLRITRSESGFESDTLAAVRFVPMTGEAQENTPERK
ncbi:MAG: protein-L-isoaspartate(D-aspartate) O-methyltransferase [Candidatus Krumholzibacteriia bacterium]